MSIDAYKNFCDGLPKLNEKKYPLAYAVNDIIENMFKAMCMSIADHDDFDAGGMDEFSSIEASIYVYLKKCNPEAAKQCALAESMAI